jgi:predicted dehydrogenase
MNQASPAQPASRIAFVGAGGMAREHIKAFRDIPGVAIAGIHSRTRAKAEALAAELQVPLVCDTIEELHDKTRADLVVMAVPELSANAVAKACFAHPWMVLAEKPLGYSLADAEDIARAAATSKRRVYVALNRRFLSSTQTVLADLAQREGPRFIAVFDQQSQALARQINHPPSVVENWMYANSIHLIDYLHAIGRGRVTNVVNATRWNGGRSPVVLASIEFDSGDVGLYQGIWHGPGPWMVHVTTPTRRWEMRPLEQAVYQNAGERTLNPVEPHAWDKAFKPGFRLQAEQAIHALHNRPTTLPTLDDAMNTMRLIARIFA